MRKIKLGDLVQVITGTEVGIRGVVEEVLVDSQIDRFNRRVGPNPNGNRLRVDGVNIRKKHRQRTATAPGEIVEIRAPIHISNVMLVCPNCDEATRVGFRFDGTKKVRYCKQCDESIDKVI